MYFDIKMPVPAEYENVVEFIRFKLHEKGMNANSWAEAQEDKFISAQTLYNILGYRYVARWPVLYEIAKRLGGEISLGGALPTDFENLIK